jgi:DNA invertase Pin-like site-specific DNA recombinase
VKFGRKPTIDREKIQHLHVQGVGASDIARQMNIGRSTVYKILNALSQENKPGNITSSNFPGASG